MKGHPDIPVAHEPFEATWGYRNFALYRRDDLGVSSGDRLRLIEIGRDEKPSGRFIVVDVDYIWRGSQHEIPPGYCVMSFRIRAPQHWHDGDESVQPSAGRRTRSGRRSA